MNESKFVRREVGDGHTFLTGWLPAEILAAISFSELWDLHPSEFPEIHMHGHRVKIPRWQQAYGVDYRFSGQISRAEPVPECLRPVLHWCHTQIDPALNGLLLNWYDGSLGHYIGRHRDSTKGLVSGSGIVTVSLGEARTFRLRPWPHRPEAKPIDFETGNGSVFILPWSTNRAFTHEVTASTRQKGKRISVTIRAFENEPPADEPRGSQP